MAFKQEYRRLGINTPLGADELVLIKLDGVEEMSHLFHYDVRMLSERDDIAANELVGQNVTISMVDVDDVQHCINGYVRRFVNEGKGDRASVYSAEIVPWLWFLSRERDCRIFQEMTVPQIIEDVFKRAGFSDYELAGLSRSYPTLEYCVQYRESSLDFVSRLMEQEGIFYFFKHQDGKHTLTLADQAGVYEPCKHAEVTFAGPLSFNEVDDDLTAWSHGYEYRSGRVAHADFDFKNPQAPIRSNEKTLVDLSAAQDLELYDYPGKFQERAEGDALARIRMEAEESHYDTVQGGSKCRSFSPGYTFTVTDHHLAHEEGQSYVLTRVEHHADVGDYVPTGEKPKGYQNEFLCVPSSIVFRPARVTPKSVVSGPQTAIVVGPSGEEIYTDEHGRVCVQFHWDRYGKADDKSSCWLRVSQSWAGKGWGAMFIPRIGQEVIVDFLEGDPDQPIITGRVYNGENTPPYELPANKHYSGIKTNSTKGGDGFNEIRLDDTKGEEQIFIHAEKNKDLRIKNDKFEWVGNDTHLVVKNNQYNHVEVNRESLIDQDDVTELGRDHHLKVGGKEAKEVGGSQSLTVKGDVIEVFKGAQSTSVTGNVYIKGAGVVIEAQQGLTLKCGGSCVVIDMAGVTVKGSKVTIDGMSTMINSGPGSPAGSGQAGSAVSPTAPTQAEDADEADPGKVAEVKAKQVEAQTGKYGSIPAPVFKPKEAAGEDPAKKSWIEIELVDEEGNAVPGERYRVTLPDGETIYEGTLDENGYARVDGIDPGQCEITFPELDKEAWERS